MPIRSIFLKNGFAALASGFLLLAASTARLPGQAAPTLQDLKPTRPNDSLRREAQHSIDTALAWLKKEQAPAGSWSNAEYPALTALVHTAFLRDPARGGRPLDESDTDESLRRAHAFLAGCAQPDGGIYRKGLGNYNTSISMVALLAENVPGNDDLLRRARGYVLGGQRHLPEGDPNDGGFGYDAKGDPHCDMSNSAYALEALALTRDLQTTAATELRKDPDLDWKAAASFLGRLQNLPGSNTQSWASDDAQNKGGFVYTPDKSTAGEVKLPDGRRALRSYGSASYAGLLSFIYADVKKDDPRVLAAHEWLRTNYTLEENPGMGKAGLYYYYELMAKALTAHGTEEMPLADGRKVRWREELAVKLMSLQNKDGFWQNENGRWWEKDPVLATAYSVLALEFMYPKM